MEPDFSLLYSELNLYPDCSLEEFKRAYRRRIAELHPDRKGGELASPEAQAALLATIATYVAVNRFYRRYGRMPGAPAPHNSVPGTDHSRAKPHSRTALPIVPPAHDDSEQRARPTLRHAIVLIVFLLLLASLDWLTLGAY